MHHRVRHTALLFLLAAASLGAQAPPSEPPSEAFVDVVEVEVVNLEVFVKDRQGRPILGLEKDDFELEIDGQSTPISNFYAAVGGRPVELTVPVESGAGETFETFDAGDRAFETPPEQRLHVAIVVDQEHIRASNRQRVFRYLRTFLDTRLPDDALVTVASLDPDLVIHTDFLADRRAVADTLYELEVVADRPRTQEIERRQILGELDTTGRVYDRRTYQRGGVTPDAMILTRIRAYAEDEFLRSQNALQALDRVVATLAGVPGRKALLYVSDGIMNRPGEDMFLSWTFRYGDGNDSAPGYRGGGMTNDYFREVGRYEILPQFEELAERANASRVSWYAIDAESDHASTVKGAAVRGGVATESIEALENNVREPAELTAQMTGGRRLQVTSSGLDLGPIAEDFSTYYSLGFKAPEGSDKRQHQIRVDVVGRAADVRHRQTWTPKSVDERMAESTLAALFYRAGANPLEVELAPGTAERQPEGSSLLPVEVRIPLRHLTLIPSGDRHALQLSLYFTTREKSGGARQVQKMPFNAAIPDAVLEQALGDAVRTTLHVVVRPGDQSLALGVRDDFGSTESYVRLDFTDGAVLGAPSR